MHDSNGSCSSLAADTYHMYKKGGKRDVFTYVCSSSASLLSNHVETGEGSLRRGLEGGSSGRGLLWMGLTGVLTELGRGELGVDTLRWRSVIARERNGSPSSIAPLLGFLSDEVRDRRVSSARICLWWSTLEPTEVRNRWLVSGGVEGRRSWTECAWCLPGMAWLIFLFFTSQGSSYSASAALVVWLGGRGMGEADWDRSCDADRIGGGETGIISSVPSLGVAGIPLLLRWCFLGGADCLLLCSSAWAAFQGVLYSSLSMICPPERVLRWPMTAPPTPPLAGPMACIWFKVLSCTSKCLLSCAWARSLSLVDRCWWCRCRSLDNVSAGAE